MMKVQEKPGVNQIPTIKNWAGRKFKVKNVAGNPTSSNIIWGLLPKNNLHATFLLRIEFFVRMKNIKMSFF